MPFSLTCWIPVPEGHHACTLGITVHNPDELPEGTLLPGNYEIVRRIGQGGMGTVYEAMQTDLRRRVAIKVLKPILARDEAHLERFRREATSSAMLEHPNIVQVTDLKRTGNLAFFVMEYLEGEPLSRTIRREGQMGLARSARIMSQVCAALQVAHDAGVVHRDLKPPNVFITPLAGGVEIAKLLDFGIQKLREGDGFARLTKTGAVVGTPQYLTPEQARGDTVDPRTDVFAAGALLYVMITGQLPFYDDDLTEMMKRIMSGPPHPIDTFRADVPKEFAAIILKALEKKPEKRWQSAREMGAELDQAIQTLPTGPSVPPQQSERPIARTSHPTESAVVLPESGRNKWLVFIGLGALAVALVSVILVVALMVLGEDSDPASGTTPPATWEFGQIDSQSVEAPKPNPSGAGLLPPAPVGVSACDEYARLICECNQHDACRTAHARLEHMHSNIGSLGSNDTLLNECRSWLLTLPPACGL